MDVLKDDVGDALKASLNGVAIDVLVNNAGSVNGQKTSPDWNVQEIFAAQKFDALSLDDMRACFELNTLVGLYKLSSLNAVDPALESAWFQPLNP